MGGSRTGLSGFGPGFGVEKQELAPKNQTVGEYTRSAIVGAYQGRLVLDGAGAEEALVQEFGDKLYGLCLRAAARGKDEVKVPLRVLRDEIGRAEFTSEMASKTRQVESLFKLYDAVEARAAEGLNKPSEAEAAATVFEELRSRFVRLVVGDTWEESPRLRLAALKRMHMYKAAERRMQRQRSNVPKAEGGGLSRKLSRRLSGSIAVGTWEDAFEDMTKAPSAKLFPLMKLLLIEAGPEPLALSDNGGENGGEDLGDIKAARRSMSDAGELADKLTMADLLGGMPAEEGGGAAQQHALPRVVLPPTLAPKAHAVMPAPQPSAATKPPMPPLQQAHAPIPDPWRIPAVHVPAAQLPHVHVDDGFGAPPAFGGGSGGLAAIPLPPAVRVPAPGAAGACGAGSPQGTGGDGVSPYLGRKDPFSRKWDDTFSDLSPLANGGRAH